MYFSGGAEILVPIGQNRQLILADGAFVDD
jgi:hypothetical protein